MYALNPSKIRALLQTFLSSKTVRYVPPSNHEFSGEVVSSFLPAIETFPAARKVKMCFGFSILPVRAKKHRAKAFSALITEPCAFTRLAQYNHRIGIARGLKAVGGVQ